MNLTAWQGAEFLQPQCSRQTGYQPDVEQSFAVRHGSVTTAIKHDSSQPNTCVSLWVHCKTSVNGFSPHPPAPALLRKHSLVSLSKHGDPL